MINTERIREIGGVARDIIGTTAILMGIVNGMDWLIDNNDLPNSLKYLEPAVGVISLTAMLFLKGRNRFFRYIPVPDFSRH